MDLAFTHGQIILEDAILEDGAVLVKKGVIAWIGPTAELPNKPSETVDLGGYYLSPGFIDLHVHGGGGMDSSSADPIGLKTICKTHEATGTTSMCLTLISSPLDQMQQALRNIHKLTSGGTGGARVLGSYLEGPFLNPTRVSVQEERWIQEPDLECLKRLAVAAGGGMRVAGRDRPWGRV
jgi:N-acetylglucosamine-6-phosphate deacetylase